MNNIENQYLELLKDILENGVEKNTRNGDTISVFGRQIRHKMSEGFPAITTKKLYMKGVITELLWFLRGGTNIKYLVDNDCHIWNGDAWANYSKKVIANNLHLIPASDSPKTKEEFINKIKTDEEFTKKWGELGSIYGKKWRDWNTKFQEMEGIKGIDQIKNLISDIKTNPDSRRLMISAWDPSDLTNQVLPPCHYGFQVYTRELNRLERIQLGLKAGWKPQDYIENFEHRDLDKWNIPTRAISLMYNCRSQDVPLGTPFNISSYGLLLEIFAKMLNMIPDELIGNLGDCHIYLNQIEGVKEQLKRKPYDLPNLSHKKNAEFYKSLSQDLTLVNELQNTDFKLENYISHPTIVMPLSN
jgi:thymidylate synthase